MEPITAAEINGVHYRCLREPINIDGSDQIRDTLAEVVRPSMRTLPAAHVCERIFEELITVLIMGIGIGARVIEERSLAREKQIVDNVLVPTAVYDHGVIGVYATPEDARAAAEKIWPETDGHHKLVIHALRVGATHDDVFRKTSALNEPPGPPRIEIRGFRG